MKYIWEPEDIIAGRLVDTRRDAERIIIGYHYPTEYDYKGTQYCLTSMRDGQVRHEKSIATKEAMAEFFNTQGYLPCDIRDDKMLRPHSIDERTR